MSDETHGYALRVDIGADIAAVWRALVEPAAIQRWCAESAQVDARAGGRYGVQLRGELTREAHIDVFAPPRRLRLIYMPLEGIAGEQPLLVDDFLLDLVHAPAPDVLGAGTVVRLLGSGFPNAAPWDALYAHLRAHWGQALRQLKLLLEQRE